MSQTNPALATQLDAELVRQAMSLIAPARRIALLAHEGPDGDCIGSALGLAQARLAGMVTKQALVLSFIDVFWFMGVAFLAATPLVFLLRGGKAQGGAPMH